MKPDCKEIEQQLSESRREFWAADATINNLELKLAEMAEQLANADSKCAELAAENAGMKSVIEYCINPDNKPEYHDQGMGCGVEDHGYQLDGYSACYYGWESAMERVYSEVIPDTTPETPATDAFLAEVRAQGVEMFASSLKVAGGGEHTYSSMANEFAAKLRQNVNSDMLYGGEPATDNTNQQFESLSRGDK